MSNQPIKYVPQKKRELTAWELYQREHPQWSKPKQLQNYVALNVAMMFLVLSTIYVLTNIKDIVMALLPLFFVVGGFLVFRRTK